MQGQEIPVKESLVYSFDVKATAVPLPNLSKHDSYEKVTLDTYMLDGKIVHVAAAASPNQCLVTQHTLGGGAFTSVMLAYPYVESDGVTTFSQPVAFSVWEYANRPSGAISPENEGNADAFMRNATYYFSTLHTPNTPIFYSSASVRVPPEPGEPFYGDDVLPRSAKRKFYATAPLLPGVSGHVFLKTQYAQTNVQARVRFVLACCREYQRFAMAFPGATHGDIKPSNFMYDPVADRAYLIDLDNVTKQDEPSHRMYTSQYAGPALLMGKKNLNDDYYSLARMACESLLGVHSPLWQAQCKQREALGKRCAQSSANRERTAYSMQADASVPTKDEKFQLEINQQDRRLLDESVEAVGLSLRNDEDLKATLALLLSLEAEEKEEAAIQASGQGAEVVDAQAAMIQALLSDDGPVDRSDTLQSLIDFMSTIVSKDEQRAAADVEINAKTLLENPRACMDQYRKQGVVPEAGVDDATYADEPNALEYSGEQNNLIRNLALSAFLAEFVNRITADGRCSVVFNMIHCLLEGDETNATKFNDIHEALQKARHAPEFLSVWNANVESARIYEYLADFKEFAAIYGFVLNAKTLKADDNRSLVTVGRLYCQMTRGDKGIDKDFARRKFFGLSARDQRMRFSGIKLYSTFFGKTWAFCNFVLFEAHSFVFNFATMLGTWAELPFYGLFKGILALAKSVHKMQGCVPLHSIFSVTLYPIGLACAVVFAVFHLVLCPRDAVETMYKETKSLLGSTLFGSKFLASAVPYFVGLCTSLIIAALYLAIIYFAAPLVATAFNGFASVPMLKIISWPLAKLSGLMGHLFCHALAACGATHLSVSTAALANISVPVTLVAGTKALHHGMFALKDLKDKCSGQVGEEANARFVSELNSP